MEKQRQRAFYIRDSISNGAALIGLAAKCNGNVKFGDAVICKGTAKNGNATNSNATALRCFEGNGCE